ncbi:MAG: hypothetical protein RL355_855 [Actinomycetota bacterium]|jgi:single-strand DNA-binding protein
MHIHSRAINYFVQNSKGVFMWQNKVSLTGRVSSTGEEVELPSGDTITKFRVVVPRDKPVTKTTIDTIDCVAFKAGVQSKIMKLETDDVVEIEGALRRRFWQTGSGSASRVEVEVATLKSVKI